MHHPPFFVIVVVLAGASSGIKRQLAKLDAWLAFAAHNLERK